MEKGFHTVRGYQLLDESRGVMTSSMEDYLEMIARSSEEDGYIRINRLSQNLNVRPSSATKVVQRLRDLGLVDYQKYGIIKLTKEGQEIGGFLLKRHKTIEQFLINIGVEKALLKDTEIIEHDISRDTYEAIFVLNEFFKKNPDVKQKYKQFRDDFYKD